MSRDIPGTHCLRERLTRSLDCLRERLTRPTPHVTIDVIRRFNESKILRTVSLLRAIIYIGKVAKSEPFKRIRNDFHNEDNKAKKCI